MNSNTKTIIFIVYLIFGLYFINLFLGAVNLGEFFNGIEKEISLIGGILLVLGSFFFLQANKRNYIR